VGTLCEIGGSGLEAAVLVADCQGIVGGVAEGRETYTEPLLFGATGRGGSVTLGTIRPLRSVIKTGHHTCLCWQRDVTAARASHPKRAHSCSL